jgi:hypothetical protein
VAGRAGFVENLIGGIGGAYTDPLNIATLPLGGFGRTILAKVGTEILVGSTIEALQQPVVADVRASQGRTELTMDDHLLRIVSAGVGAGAFRTGFELAPYVGQAITPQGVQDFFAIRRAEGELRVNPFEVTRAALEELDPGLRGMAPLERDALFAAADALVAAAGGSVSASASKLGRALGV